jgi:NAD-dependent DNA ligase
MARLSKVDLAQMGAAYFESLEQERLVEVAKNLYELAVEQLEKLELSSQNSSRPPSSDTPYKGRIIPSGRRHKAGVARAEEPLRE